MLTKKIKNILLCVSAILLLSSNLFAQKKQDELMKLNHTQFDLVTHQMEIIPGMWRPMFGSEQVAWISPPWESQEYVWFDFPETIWIDGNVTYLGHIDKRFPTAFPKIKSALWQKIKNGISYKELLPNGISFGGEIIKKKENIASLKLWITNGSKKELKEVMLLTCVYLDPIKEFNEETNNNKYVHIRNKGWMPFDKAVEQDTIKEGFRVGWLKGGKLVSDLPVVVTKSKTENHLLGFTWFDDTFSFVGNPEHPCVHADPIFDNLTPGESQTINGELIFFEGSIEEFEIMFRERIKNRK